jgi:DNA-binding NarL/FixJ family response regulator
MDTYTVHGGATVDAVAQAHAADLKTQGAHGVRYLRYWVSEAEGKIFCLVEAPSAEAANTVHREAHGLVADEDELRDALRRLDELGAKATAGLARQKLRHIGARSVPAGPRRATRAHPLGLTPRECEVLELICERQTNAQIARTLFISAKTVDHHVSAVLAKLGVENREAAADMSRNLTA